MSNKTLQESHKKEVHHLNGVIGSLREQLDILSEATNSSSNKRNHSPSPTKSSIKKSKYGIMFVNLTLRPTPAKHFKFIGEGKCVSLKPGIRVFEDKESRFILRSELLRASGKSSLRFAGLTEARVDFRQLKREYDINHGTAKAFILDESLLNFVCIFSGDLAANLKTLAELDLNNA
jgi:hypothetical protein